MDDDFALIDFVKNFRQIYDRKTAQFKNKLARRNAWDTIGKILNRNPEECESRWSILRNRYSNEKRKIRKGFPDAIDKNVENSEWFRKMSFLDGFIIPRQSYKHLRRTVDTLDKKSGIILEQGESIIEENETDNFPENPKFPIKKDENHGLDLTVLPNRSSQQSVCSDIKPLAHNLGRKRTNNGSLDEILHETLTNLLDYLKQRQKAIENDLDVQFGKTIALMLKDLPPEKKKSKQKQIIDLILE